MILYDQMTAFFAAHGWATRPVPRATAVELDRETEVGRWSCVGQVFEEDGVFLFHSILLDRVPPHRHRTVTELVAWINGHITLGTFEWDADEGQVRVRTGIDVEGASLTPALLRNVVLNNLALAERYLPQLRRAALDSALDDPPREPSSGQG